MTDRRAARFAHEAPRFASIIAPASVMIGSLLACVTPLIATVPIAPPFGLLVLIAWRLRRPDAFRTWVPVLLGLFDDLVSGQPLGSAMLFWTLATLAIAVLETRLVWRDLRQDWLVAIAIIAGCLIGGRLVATPLGAHVDAAVLLQIVASAALYPIAARLVARLDRWVGG